MQAVLGTQCEIIMSNPDWHRPCSIEEVRERTRKWLNYICDEYFDGNVRAMATALGYDDAGRSKLDRVLKRKTVKIDPDMISHVEEWAKEELGPDSLRMPPEPVVVDYVSLTVDADGDAYAYEEEIDGQYLVDPREMNAAPEETPRKFVVQIKGDAMAPEFVEGDHVVVEEHNSAARVPIDGVYVFRLEDTIQVKRLQRVPNNRLRVLSSNDRYPPYEIDLSSGVDFELIGCVWGRFKQF